MTGSTWIGALAVAAVIAFLAVAFRRSRKVKPDPNRKTEDWPRITQGGVD